MDSERSLRVDRLGSIAAPFTLEALRELSRVSKLVEQKKVNRIALLSAVTYACRAGTNQRRSEVVMRELGPLLDAFVVLAVFDASKLASRQAIHDALRALPMPAIDALDDLFAVVTSVAPILETERMYRAALLEGDWAIEYRAPHQARVRLRIRDAEAIA